MRFFSGDLIMSAAWGLGRVVPLWPLGLPGKRFVQFVWSPLRVGYMRLEEGVWGFSYRIRLRLRASISFLRLRFSCVSCWIFWQVWQFAFVMQVILVVSFDVMLFVEDYDVDASSDVFFGASYFGAVSYWCDFAFEEACDAVNC